MSCNCHQAQALGYGACTMCTVQAIRRTEGQRPQRRPRRRQRSSSLLTLGRFVALLFLVGLVFHYPWLLLVLLVLVLGVLGPAVQLWRQRVQDNADPSRPKPGPPREPTVQVLTAGMLVVSTHPAAVLHPRMIGHIVQPTAAELLARDFELGTNLVLVDWHGGRRQWESLPHLELWREKPWPPSGTPGGRRP